MSGWGQKDLPQVRKGSGGILVGLMGIGRTSRRSKRCRETFTDVREGSEGPPAGPEKGREEFS